MRKLYTLAILLLSCFAIQAQNPNGIDVRNFISPVAGFNYGSNATEAIEVRFANDGPNALFAQDSIEFTVTIGFGDSTEFYSIKKRVGATLYTDDRNDYVLIPAYNFSVEHSYTICVTAEGTNDYPINTTKNARSCVSFLVGIDETKPRVSALYFSEEHLQVSFERNFTGRAIVYDLTGKTLVEQQLNNTIDHNIPFSSPAKGFYFLQLIDENGKSAISKFVTH